jgi:hypothetical protein
MLRLFALLLLLANLVFWAWSRGMLDDAIGPLSKPEREPERYALQVHPDWVKVLPPKAASAALAKAADEAAANPPAAASAVAGSGEVASAVEGRAASNCIESGPFTTAEKPVAEALLRSAGLAEGDWVADKVDRKGSYMVYMGKYPDRDTLTRKLDELHRLKIDADILTNWTEMQPGLSLGRYSDRYGAEAALAKLAAKGARSARVVVQSQAMVGTLLRVTKADAALRDKLAGLRFTPPDHGFVACRGN